MYKVEETIDGIIVHGIKDFVPEHVFECGQCFRWNKHPGGYYQGVASGKYAEVMVNDGVLTLKGVTKEEFYDFWFEYFDLGTDYSVIKDKLSSVDEYMEQAVSFGKGIRILNQDPFETLISFIISSNNNIPRIKKCIENLCRDYGTYIKEGFYTFPSASALAELSEEEISICTHAGYRCNYISEAAKLFEIKSFDRNMFSNMTIEEARKVLCTYKGVGPKVADCILLFIGAQNNAFPVDVWVRKVMSKLYGVETPKQIEGFQREYFRDLAGYAQQYLFYAVREGFIKA